MIERGQHRAELRNSHSRVAIGLALSTFAILACLLPTTMTPTPASSMCVSPGQATQVSEFIQQLGATAAAGDDLDRQRATQAIRIVTSSPMPSRLCNPTEEAQTEVVQSYDNMMNKVLEGTRAAMTQTAVANETQTPESQGFSSPNKQIVFAR